MVNKSLIKNLTKEKYYILKYRFLTNIVFAFLVVFTTTLAAQNNGNKSPALELLLQQIEKEYVPSQWNMNMDEIARDIPFLYVELVGYAMFYQNKYLVQNPTGLNKFDELNEEIKGLIPLIAGDYNKATNKYIDPEMLKAFYIRALYGESGQEFRKYYKDQTGKYIAQINFPYILDKVPEPVGIKRAKKNAIVLLGQEADKVEHDLQYDSNEEMPLPEDIIVGTWVDSKTGKAIQFHKEGNGYVTQYVKVLGEERIAVYVYLAKTQIRKAVHMYYGVGRSYQGMESFVYDKKRRDEEASFVVEWDKKVKRYSVWLVSLKMNPGGLFYKK